MCEDSEETGPMERQAWARESRKLSFISIRAKVIIECKCQARGFLYEGTKGAKSFQTTKVVKV